jgi:glycosyltransferase involved in cell wall biosynthesis
MSCAMFEIEVTKPLPRLSLNEGQTGLAIIVRRKGRPVGFWLDAPAPKKVVEPEDLAQRIIGEAGQALMAEAIREEIASPPEATLPSVTIAICTKDRPDQLAGLLTSLQSSVAAAVRQNAALEIIVIDNAPSDDRTRQTALSFPGTRYALEPKPGLNFARNRAVLEARGDWVAFMDDDVAADAGWLDGFLDAAVAYSDAGCITGLVLPLQLQTEAQILFEKRGGFRVMGFQRAVHRPFCEGKRFYPCFPGLFGTGANMAVRRDVVRTLGGFDEALDTGAPLPGGGDLDIFYRTIRAGHALVYEPSALVFHRHRRKMKELRRQYWSWGLGFMSFATKSYRTDPPARRHLRRAINGEFKRPLFQLGKSLLRRDGVSSALVLAQLWGCMAGLMGGYDRSLRRIEEIRRRHA